MLHILFQMRLKHLCSNATRALFLMVSNFFIIKKILYKFSYLLAFNCFLPSFLLAEEFSWHEVSPGYSIGKFSLSSTALVLKSEVLLLKFDTKRFDLKLSLPYIEKEESSDLQLLTKQAGGIAGINAHFFDPNNRPIGLIISDGKLLQAIHKGGKLLNGFFVLENNIPKILERHAILQKPQLAIQAGPLLLIDGKIQSVKSDEIASRRSGIALTKNSEVILYATILRFPGASLSQIQNMLTHPEIEAKDALNLDGGGSSQLFIKKNIALEDDTFVTGGDLVPTGLIVEEKTKQ
jgi:uncharacterized protein YigE (DUF2233 family)